MPELPLSEALLRPIDALEAAGHETWLVGASLRRALAGEESADFECACLASPEEVLRALPRAVVTGPAARRLTEPTAAGPLDVLPLGRTSLPEELAHRDFTIHAMAWRRRSGTLLDPHGGRRDLDAGRLRAPGVAKERLAEDPLRALRTLRLVSEHGFEPDPELLAALPEQATALRAMGGRRVRVELEHLLQGDHATRALLLLRSSGLETALAPGVREDAPQVVGRLPRDLELRLAAWLRGSRVRAVLRDLRCPRDRSLRIERLLQLHPVDAGSAAAREVRARKLLRRDALLRQRLVSLRRAEVEVGGEEHARRSLDRLLRTLEALQRAERVAEQRARLCLGGREVMEILGCGPGARVGAALRFLSERVAEDPSCNQPETLRRLLLDWSASDGPAGNAKLD